MAASAILIAFLQFDFSAARLRADTLSIAVGFIALAVAVAAFTVFFLRRNRSDRTLLWFSIFAALYGTRILLGVPVFRGGFNLSYPAAHKVIDLITCTIQVPGVLFAVAIIDAWRSWLSRLLLGAAFAEALAGTFIIASGIGERRAIDINNILVIVLFCPGYVWLFYKNDEGRRMKVLKISFLIFLAVVIFDNLGGIGVIHSSLRIEYLGFIVLLAGMGWAAAQRAISDQQRLVAIDSEMEIARSIQKSILPESVPQVPGVEIAVRYEPMTAVAGDFYDFIRLDDGRIGVLVADVSGHGVPAALIASMLKMAFAAHAGEAHDPAQLLSKLNAAMCGKFRAHFVTAVYAVIDPVRRTLTFSGAAHPPILLGRNGHSQELAENGLMLGAFPFAQYANAQVTISPGDRLLLYTDGLVEAPNPQKEEFGSERLKAALDGNGAGQLIGRIFEDVAAWSGLRKGRQQEDDLTAVAIMIAQ